MAKKNPLIILGLLAGIGYAGYEIYKRTIKKTPTTPTPEPGTPTIPDVPTPGTPKSTPALPTASDVNQLQQLMIQWYRGKAINNITYTEAEARGGWGTKSQTALRNLYPKLFDSDKLTAGNVTKYINLMKDNLARRGEAEKNQQTKQASQNELLKLTKQLVNQNVTGRRALKVLVPFTAIEHKFDRARNSYISLGNSKQFVKGQTIDPGMTIDRQNGQILIKGKSSTDKNSVYPTNPNNLYVG